MEEPWKSGDLKSWEATMIELLAAAARNVIKYSWLPGRKVSRKERSEWGAVDGLS